MRPEERGRAGPEPDPKRGRRARRLRRLGVALLAGALLLLVAALRLTRDPTARILERRGALQEVVETAAVGGPAHDDFELRLVSTSGLEVELAVRRPAGAADRPLPAALVLGGHRTGRDAAKLIEAEGVVVAAMSYPTRVRRIRGVGDALDVRRAILETPSAVMLAMDHLSALPYVDPDRVELVGVSLGAPFACVAGGLDARFRRVWAIHGGGDPRLLFEHALADELGFAPARDLAAFLIALVGHGFTLAPEEWAGKIAPTPFVMVNAEGDDRIPRASVELLYEAAREPKELVWVPGGHVSGRKEDQVRALCEMVIARMAEDP